MPIYDYRCSSCNSLYEVYHKTKELSEDIVCPACGSSEYKKLISIPGIVANGPSKAESSQGSCQMGDCCRGICSN